MSEALSSKIQVYRSLYKPYLKGELSEQGREDFEGLGSEILSGLELIRVTPKAEHVVFHNQLVGRDPVHSLGVETVSRLKKMRLGLHENSAKNAFVLANDDTVYSAIYVHSSHQPVADDGLVAPENVQGDVYSILIQKQSLVDDPNTGVFFSVANLGKGEDNIPGVGPMMVKRIHGHLDDYDMKSTLSPFRYFSQYAENVQDVTGADWDDDMKKLQALMFMIHYNHHSQKVRDPVFKLHALEGGAEVYDINVHSNIPESKDGRDGLGVMINYRYPNDVSEIARNKERARAGDLPLGSALVDFLIDKGYRLDDFNKQVIDSDPEELALSI